MVARQFARMVKKARRDRGWTQAHLASLLAVHEDRVRRLERASVDPTLTLVARAAALLDLDLNRLVTPPTRPR